MSIVVDGHEVTYIVDRDDGSGLYYVTGGDAGYLDLAARSLRWTPSFRLIRELVEGVNLYLDLGANIGLYSLPVARSVRRVVSVEALWSNFQRLILNQRINSISNLAVHHIAVGSREGWLDFEGLSAWGHAAGEATGLGVIMEPSREVVREMSLDDLIHATCDSVPNVIKVDVEGSEVELLPELTSLMRSSPDTLAIVESNPYTFVRPSVDILSSLRSSGLLAFVVTSEGLEDPEGPQLDVVSDLLVMNPNSGSTKSSELLRRVYRPNVEQLANQAKTLVSGSPEHRAWLSVAAEGYSAEIRQTLTGFVEGALVSMSGEERQVHESLVAQLESKWLGP